MYFYFLFSIYFIISYRFQLCSRNINTVLISIITKIKSSVFPALHLQRVLVLAEYNKHLVNNDKNPLALGIRYNRFLLYILFL